MIKVLGKVITPTMFPDKTSQVWKINLKDITGQSDVTIHWQYENEAELIHVCQLNILLTRALGVKRVSLKVPYLPYARQDKEVSNDSTFALRTFAKLINSQKFHLIFTVDVHSREALRLFPNLIVLPANHYFRPDEDTVLCYPDKGAADRYKDQFPNDYIILDKKRNQLTGEIEGLTFGYSSVNDLNDKTKICIVDDICDGGRTFIEAAKLLKTLKPKEIHLYVSHGIFSKGLHPLIEAGITRIFTHKGEVDVKNYYNNTIEER